MTFFFFLIYHRINISIKKRSKNYFLFTRELISNFIKTINQQIFASDLLKFILSI
jgi:hypothetical protein